MKKSVFTAILILMTGLLSAAPVGKIVFLEGNVKIVRNEKTLASDKLDFGTLIENYDMIATGPKSTVEIKLDPKTGIGGTIKLSPNSAFYLELSSLKKEQTGSVELLKGAISLKVDKMIGKTGLNVRTDTAVMGVRGTQFKVIGTNGGEFLVTCSEGKVECTSDKGEILAALPGAAVEVIPGQEFRTIPVAVSTLETFENNWNTERSTALEANALRAIKNFGKRYEELSAKLRRAYEKLQQDGGTTIAAWKEQERKGIMSDRAGLIKEKKALIGNLLQMRRVLFIFERVYYRLAELKDYAAKLDPKTELRKGYTIKDFYAQLEKDEKTFSLWMGQFRYLMKLYSDRNEGTFPTDSFGTDDFSEDSFFN